MGICHCSAYKSKLKYTEWNQNAKPIVLQLQPTKIINIKWWKFSNIYEISRHFCNWKNCNFFFILSQLIFTAAPPSSHFPSPPVKPSSLWLMWVDWFGYRNFVFFKLRQFSFHLWSRIEVFCLLHHRKLKLFMEFGWCKIARV